MPGSSRSAGRAQPALGVRAARTVDAAAVAELWLRTRAASVPAIPEPVHDEDDVRTWVEHVLIPAGSTWVVERGSDVVAMMSMEGNMIDQLYVAPDQQHQGLGTMLVELARELSPRELKLWTFQSNIRARMFYEGLGFVVVAMTDGDNEEGEPDVLYRWSA
jgi:GNAT superfamily N-acetyltransferase